jgi:FtsZ-interacting cell division protein ZipA
VIVGIVIGSVIVALVVIMKWADRRDRAKGHVNRGMGDIRSTMRDQRRNARLLRQPGARGATRSPHSLPPEKHRR